MMAVIDSLDHQVRHANNGQQAIELFKQEKPDLILMDVMMPGMDGYTCTREIRRLSQDRWIPILFLSAKSSTEDQIAGLEAGGDDYLLKPIDLPMLSAKIQAMQRIANLQKTLQLYKESAEEEKALAKELLERITKTSELDDAAISSWFVPAEQLSGDLIAAARTNANHLNILVADSTGHGLSAAFSQLPVSQIFYAMTKQGFTASTIVREMNKTLKQIMPTGRFVAISLIAMNEEAGFAEIYNCGNPSLYFLSKDRQKFHTFASTDCPLGIISPEKFQPKAQIFHWETEGELLLFSDGLFDAKNPSQEMYGEEKAVALMQEKSSESIFHRLRRSVQNHLQGLPAHDDISLVSVRCKPVVKT